MHITEQAFREMQTLVLNSAGPTAPKAKDGAARAIANRFGDGFDLASTPPRTELWNAAAITPGRTPQKLASTPPGDSDTFVRLRGAMAAAGKVLGAYF